MRHSLIDRFFDSDESFTWILIDGEEIAFLQQVNQ